ncbi:MAG: acyl-CoA dehydrogenase family protein [Planctomycetota bacterium]|jgi:glutaryl-CoA dehydrogenase|nr:acyl-CoA dehydrogenase family protein [Planctomycetota bacterium]MSR38402.1 acyl-CoA dehydrogenase [Planctomycetota bacterium]
MSDQYKALDFFDVDELYTDEERMIRDSIRSWVSDRFMPVIQEHNRNATFPTHLIKELGEMGVYGSSLTGYGCAGLSPIASGLICTELERGDSGLRSFVSVQGSLCMFPIHAWGTEEQKQKYLPKMAKGELIGCFGLTEADFGSNPGGMLTKAVKDGDHYILNGSKYWITNGSVADVAVVWAKLDGVVKAFLIDKGTKGFRGKEIKNKFSLRASDTSELILEDVRVHKSALLPLVEGLKGPLGCLTQARFGISFGAIGAAQAVFDEACRYSQIRVQFDKPIGRFQLVQNKLVWMAAEITKAQLLCWKLGKMKEAGKMQHFHVSMAKRNSCWMALESCRLARDILGANGITDEYQTMRHMCNLESVITYEGTHDIHGLIIGRQLTGLDAIM